MILNGQFYARAPASVRGPMCSHISLCRKHQLTRSPNCMCGCIYPQLYSEHKTNGELIANMISSEVNNLEKDEWFSADTVYSPDIGIGDNNITKPDLNNPDFGNNISTAVVEKNKSIL